MPKIIPGLQESLLEHSRRLFSERGYTRTELRDVAAAAGCSVGNIYNYYKSKPHLFLAVTEGWRQALAKEILVQILASGDPLERVEAICLLVYTQVDNLQGLWKEFFVEGFKVMKDQECLVMMKEMEEQEQKLMDAVENLLLQANPHLDQGRGTSKGRWASVLLGAVFQLPRRYPKEENTNRQFIHDLVRQIARKEK